MLISVYILKVCVSSDIFFLDQSFNSSSFQISAPLLFVCTPHSEFKFVFIYLFTEKKLKTVNFFKIGTL